MGPKAKLAHIVEWVLAKMTDLYVVSCTERDTIIKSGIIDLRKVLVINNTINCKEYKIIKQEKNPKTKYGILEKIKLFWELVVW